MDFKTEIDKHLEQLTKPRPGFVSEVVLIWRPSCGDSETVRDQNVTVDATDMGVNLIKILPGNKVQVRFYPWSTVQYVEHTKDAVQERPKEDEHARKD